MSMTQNSVSVLAQASMLPARLEFDRFSYAACKLYVLFIANASGEGSQASLA